MILKTQQSLADSLSLNVKRLGIRFLVLLRITDPISNPSTASLIIEICL